MAMNEGGMMQAEGGNSRVNRAMGPTDQLVQRTAARVKHLSQLTERIEQQEQRMFGGRPPEPTDRDVRDRGRTTDVPGVGGVIGELHVLADQEDDFVRRIERALARFEGS